MAKLTTRGQAAGILIDQIVDLREDDAARALHLDAHEVARREAGSVTGRGRNRDLVLGRDPTSPVPR